LDLNHKTVIIASMETKKDPLLAQIEGLYPEGDLSQHEAREASNSIVSLFEILIEIDQDQKKERKEER
ncbi:MAG: hypothetical protein JW812_02485, partial [Alphaproteobacteria bacterium]|nr:hypothetical protein [Alphaproteobacteria bacterium]